MGIRLSVCVLGEQGDLILISTYEPDTVFGAFPAMSPCGLFNNRCLGQIVIPVLRTGEQTAATPDGNLVSGPALHAAKLSPRETRGAPRAARLGARLRLSVVL